MAEIEHFCDPADKNHPKFESIRETELLLFSAANQMDGKPAELHSIGQAVDKVKQKFTVLEHLECSAHNCLVCTCIVYMYMHECLHAGVK
jgi:glycyl-tRNA synthetase